MKNTFCLLSAARALPSMLMADKLMLKETSITMKRWRGRDEGMADGVEIFPGLPAVTQHWESKNELNKTVVWSREWEEEATHDPSQHAQLDVTIVANFKMGNSIVGSCDGDDCLYERFLLISRSNALNSLFQSLLS